MTKSEHATILFVKAAYYWLIGDDEEAESLVRYASYVVNNPRADA